MDVKNEFKNETDYNIILFNADKLYKHKTLYKYMPKLVQTLQQLTLKYSAREDIGDDLDRLMEYVIRSSEPELTFIAVLKPGDYGMVPRYSYAYAYSIIPYDRTINPRISIAIDITENKFDAETVDIIDKRGMSRIRETVPHRGNPELVNRAYVTGQDDMRRVSVWKLTRHPFSYVVIDARSTADAVWSSSCNVIPWWCLAVIILFIILAGILFFGLYHVIKYTEILSDNELGRLL
jgi:hypothetical protein